MPSMISIRPSLRRRLISLLLAVSAATMLPAKEVLSLAGEWRLVLGGPVPTFPQAALPAVAFDDRIVLPATTETAGKGPRNDARETWNLTRIRKYEGPVWYEREVDIPAAWAGKRLELLLERTKYSQVWFDRQPMGAQALFGSPQVRRLGPAVPGRHRITVLVDNRSERWPAKGWDAHQNSDATQTNWNGIIGRIELCALDPVALSSVMITPQVADASFRVRVTVDNTTGQDASGELTVSAVSTNHSGAPHVPTPVVVPVHLAAASNGTIEAVLSLGEGARRWDEFEPNLYTITVILNTPAGRDQRSIDTGLREFLGTSGQFTINGRITFLRGKHDACVFPLTGHPPMDVDGWLAYLGTLKTWGINHLRCHTWIPPEAAFIAADRLGMYVQPELPFWGILNQQIRDGLMPEAEALLAHLGNHPSFVMLSLGNELQGDRRMMSEMIGILRRQDPSRLYADGSNTIHWDAREQPHNNWRTAATVPVNGQQVRVRGSFGGQFADQGIVQTGDGSTRDDYREALVGATMPLVAHETGQFGIFPDLREIPRYTGVVQARNFEQYRETLVRKGMIDQADDFLRASGALAADLYKEDQERYLRTPGFGGFQVLDLQDFPGQGTALVGLLNALMEDKGVTTPASWRRACAPVTVLARFDRCIWTTAQHYVADLELAHYGAADWTNVSTEWSLVDAVGHVVARGTFAAARLAQGKLHSLGRVEVPLAGITVPSRLELRVETRAGAGGRHDGQPSLDHTENCWPLWVYPATIVQPTAPGVLVAKVWDAAVEQRLAAGGRVLLIPSGDNWGNPLTGGYANDYWSWNFFHNQPGTLGLLAEEHHAALAGFPTRFHSERQWSAIAHAARPVILSDLPAGTRPIVQVIDNPVRCERLGLIFELAVGSGRLLVCAADLDALAAEHPEAAQLRASLLAYAASPAFSPATTRTLSETAALFTPSLSLAKGRIATASSAQPDHQPDLAVDNDDGSRWCADGPGPAQWLAVDLGAVHDLSRVIIAWEQDRPGYRYRLEGSADGVTWQFLSDQTANVFPGGTHRLELTARGIRHLRINTTALPDGSWASIRDLRVFGN
jgi:hypothetical protein